MHSGLGGNEILNVYAEAIAKMPENPGIPLLFREIFKNAYLPYRDPETLKMFLKVIDEFNYDQSERLGDAFEYLLSVLGSQGDAGQFLTPRHIINFIVAIVDPKKTETVLDPACGTAGFLISSYKHILKANTDAKGNITLTPDERGRLAQNFKGYDISPDMVRLSLVNMYLHGFADPHIAEYDTLTSQERWNEYADVILANPPFMSPKGGIMPHKRFSVQSKRSEVLFVDYMAEHLTPNGRAGIIVPEGIIFQSQNAYTQLRKMLVEKYLVAVVSLPAGVFNPYSGVKTSILILDKTLAKKTNTIAFFKIQNDGFGLGAQRREIDKNDLPQAQAELGEYLRRLLVGEPIADFQPTLGLIVDKETIAANGEYNLSGERYREGDRKYSQYPHVELGEVVEILDSLRRPITKSDRNPGPYPYYGATGILDYVEGYLFDEPLVLVGEDGAKWDSGENSAFFVEGKVWVNNHAHVLRPKRDRLMDRFLIEILNEADLKQYVTGVTVPKLNQEKLRSIQIPLPPLEVQKEIVTEIEGYQKVINGARMVIDNYRPHIPINPDWPMVTIGDLCIVERGASPRPIHDFITDAPDDVNWIKIGDAEVGGKYITQTNERITPEGAAKSRHVKPGDFILSNSMSFGRPYIMAIEGCIHDGWLLLRNFAKELNSDFLYNILGSNIVIEQFERAATGGVVNNLNSELVRNVRIPLPPLATQKVIVAEIEKEQSLVAANRELITRFEKKIQATLGRVWSEANQPIAMV
jgi:type I restriction enzyme M protein